MTMRSMHVCDLCGAESATRKGWFTFHMTRSIPRNIAKSGYLSDEGEFCSEECLRLAFDKFIREGTPWTNGGQFK